MTNPHNGRVTPKRPQGGPVNNPGPSMEPEGEELFIPLKTRASLPPVLSRSKNDQKVMVGYSHPSHPPAKFFHSLTALYRLDTLGAETPEGRKIGGHGRVWMGGAQAAMEAGAEITKTRNRIVREFLDIGDIDWLWMVDADMTFEPDILERLIEAAHPTLRPIMGGLCFAWMADAPLGRKVWPTLYAYVKGSQRLRRLTTYPPDTLLPVAGTGAACLLIHRTVLEAMAERWQTWHPPRTFFAATPFCELDEDGKPDWRTGDEYSEDLTFCLRAQAAGFPVHVHTGIRLGHVKEIVVTEEMFLAESAALHEACKPRFPTYAVIASKNRPEMLANLVSQLADQVTGIFVMDNGYADPSVIPQRVEVHTMGSGPHKTYAAGPPVTVVPCHGMTLTEMWNAGWAQAEENACGAFDLLVLNDDVEVPTDFVVRLEECLRLTDEHWIAYPNHREIELPPEGFARTQSDSMAGQTMSGFAFMVSSEAAVKFDERFQWWYSDSDLERQAREAGKYTVCVNTAVRHLEPLKSTMENPERLAQAEADEALFAEKWGLDPSTLWLAQRKADVE